MASWIESGIGISEALMLSGPASSSFWITSVRLNWTSAYMLAQCFARLWQHGGLHTSRRLCGAVGGVVPGTCRSGIGREVALACRHDVQTVPLRDAEFLCESVREVVSDVVQLVRDLVADFTEPAFDLAPKRGCRRLGAGCC